MDVMAQYRWARGGSPIIKVYPCNYGYQFEVWFRGEIYSRGWMPTEQGAWDEAILDHNAVLRDELEPIRNP